MRRAENLHAILVTIVLTLVCYAVPSSADTLVTTETVSRIAFGSCNSERKPQPLWPVIAKDEPSLWIWTGDNIYADTEDAQVFRAKYDQQLEHPGYGAFARRVPFMTGTWDDHDYGVNDGGNEYPKKELAKAELYRFLSVPDDDVSRERPGIYRHYDYGPADQRVRVILLDTRWFRDPLERTEGPDRSYIPNTVGTVLGDAQWTWLETQLSDPEPEVTIIVSSIQVVASEHRFEKWANFPNEQNRLYELLSKYQGGKVFVISGDRHAGEISAESVKSGPTPLIDVTSSGLTNTWSRQFDETNSRALGPKVIENNYGLIEIDWRDAASPVVTISIKGTEGVIQATIL
jgi:alkaline phosphatase D